MAKSSGSLWSPHRIAAGCSYLMATTSCSPRATQTLTKWMTSTSPRSLAFDQAAHDQPAVATFFYLIRLRSTS
jgi:hypothetical protein